MGVQDIDEVIKAQDLCALEKSTDRMRRMHFAGFLAEVGNFSALYGIVIWRANSPALCRH
jgi:hypothetical protein